MANFFKNRKLKELLILISLFIFTGCSQQGEQDKTDSQEYFTNPILDEGPDPFVYLHEDGFYYSMVTKGNYLQLWKSESFTDLADAETKVIWNPPLSGSNTCCIWAPEIHYLDGVWYIYYSATDKDHPVDDFRFIHVLKNASPDPFSESWEDLGKVQTAYPGIDGHVFDFKGTRYFAYSPYIGMQSGIILARMSSPTRLENEVVLGLPLYDWEKTPPREILEGPQFLEGPTDKIFIVYSAGACWDDNYGLGIFYASKDSDLLNPASWARSDHQLFEQCPDSSVFGPGHNCFTKSPDGKEDWIVYHAKMKSSNECEGRSTRAQKLSWDQNGFPVFGKPVSIEFPLGQPSGI